MNEIKHRTWDWLSQMFVWDTSEKQRMARAAMAAGLGLPSESYARPFPGSHTVVQMTPPQPGRPPTASGWLGKAALIGALVAGGGGLGAGAVVLGSLLNRPTQPASTETEKVLQPQEYEIRWEFKDGKLQMSEPKRIK